MKCTNWVKRTGAKPEEPGVAVALEILELWRTIAIAAVRSGDGATQASKTANVIAEMYGKERLRFLDECGM